MKLGKDTLWIEIFTNWHKFLMTSSSCWFYDVIKIEQLKVCWLLLNISKTIELIFTKLMPTLGNHLYKFLKLKDWRQVIHCCHGNQFIRECWDKIHDLREEKWHFLKISTWYCNTPNFSLIYSKTKKQWRLSTSLVVVTSKWRLWRYTFKLEMMSSIFFNFTRFLPIVYSYQVSASSDLNQKNLWKICLFDHVFSQALPH